MLPPAENKSRFQRVLLSFMQVFLAQYPTILFLDDILFVFLILPTFTYFVSFLVCILIINRHAMGRPIHGKLARGTGAGQHS